MGDAHAADSFFGSAGDDGFWGRSGRTKRADKAASGRAGRAAKAGTRQQPPPGRRGEGRRRNGGPD
ncbi:MAG: hypothetical protein ACLFXM_01625, partial [Acidimicrobiia bacterium]